MTDGPDTDRELVYPGRRYTTRGRRRATQLPPKSAVQPNGRKARRTISIAGMGGDSRGISDALGYIFVFAIIIATMAVVYLNGFQSMNDAKQFERMNNAERAFDVLADNVEDITDRGAPSRATEVKLSETSVGVGTEIEINFTVTDATNPNKNTSHQFESFPVRFNASDENGMVYANGAVFRESVGGSVMTHEPGIQVSDNRVLLPLIQLRQLEGGGIAGSTTVLIRTEHVSTEIFSLNTSNSDVWLNLSTPRAPAWRSYLEEKPGADCTHPDNTDTFAACKFTGKDRVVVTIITIDVTFVD